MKNFFAVARKTLPPSLLLVAGTLSPCLLFAQDAARPAYDVADGDALRKYLSEKYQPEGTTGESARAYYNNADLTLTGSFAVDTTKTTTSTGDDGVQTSVTTGTGAIEVLATGVKIFGGGNTISSSALELSTKGPGDLFFISGTKLSVENVVFAGTSDATKKTGRVFTTGNTTAGTALNIGAGTRVENRRHVADASTNYRASGGALVSAHIMDEVRISTASGGNGNVVFSGNLAHGATLAAESEGGEAVNLSAQGGAAFTSGLLEISGAGKTIFENNTALSDASTASGGAVFVFSANLNADGSSGSTKYPDSVTVGEGAEKNFGLQISETTANFSGNAARGASAQGGAVAVAAGWFDAAGATLNFGGNAAKGTAASATVGGGALVVMDGGRATFDAGTTVVFENNSATGTHELSTASGGAVAVADASASFAGTATTFSGNTAEVFGAGSVAQGGAAYFSGTLEETKNEDGETVQTHTAEVSLAGTLSFGDNSAEASGLARVPATDAGASSTAAETEPTESAARGGALVVAGAKVDGSALASLLFAANAATAKTSAQGGALASVDAASETTLAASGDLVFSNNLAGLLALGADEAQTAGVVAEAGGGAVHVSAGTLKMSAAGTLSFDLNTADALSSGQADAVARGGAVHQSGGALALASANFSGNAARGLVSQGGAIYASGGTQTFTGTTTNFSSNTASAGDAALSAAGTTFARGGAIFSTTGATQTFEGAAVFSGNSAKAASVAGSGADGRRSGAAGGAVYSAGTLSFASANFSSNTASVEGDAGGAAFGGAVYVSGGTFSAAQNFTAQNNGASALSDAAGGAVYVGSAGVASLSSANFSGNSASAASASGGAVHSAGTLRIVGDGSMTGNAATGTSEARGGAIAVSSGSLSVSGAATRFEISANTASATGGNAYGGGVYVGGGSVSLENAKILNNTASATGGNAYGGGVFLDVGANVALTLSGNTEISGNSSTTGGAGDGVFVGASSATTSAGTATLVIDAGADVVENEDGTTTRENVETATISDKITVAAGTLALRKTGAGDLRLGDVSVADGSAASLDFSAGETTLAGAVSASGAGALKSFSVGSGATVSLAGTLEKFSEATVAGTLSVSAGADFTFATATALTGTLALSDGAAAKVSGATTVSGAGTFSVKNATLSFADASATLSAETLSVGAGTLALDGAGTLTLTDEIVFTETGAATITLNGATLAATRFARAADGVNVTIDGAGTLLLYVAAEDAAENVAFPSFSEKVEDADGNTSTVVREGSFTIGENVKLEAGISVGEGATLTLSPGSQVAGRKNILLSGGTLLAAGTSEAAPLELETISVSGTGSKLGDGATTQFFKMVETTETSTDASGAETTTQVTHSLVLSGSLEITEQATFVGNVAFSGTRGTLSGAGTVRGDVAGTGTVSLARVEGDLNVSNGSGMTVAGTLAVGGDVNVYSDRVSGVSSNARFTFSSGASLSAANFYNYGRAATAADAGTARFSGAFVNAGTLVVGENTTFVFESGSTFVNGVSSGTEILSGVVDISASGSAVDFSGATSVDLSAGTVLVDALSLRRGDALPIYGADLSSVSLEALLVDENGYDLGDRFTWDALAGTLVFNGLNGEAYRGTIYGDWQRESLNRTHDFMRAAQARAFMRQITPRLYGENKLESPYMRGYLEKMRQRGGEVSAEAEARRKEELALAEALNSRTANFWAQGDFSFREQRERHGFDAYDATTAGALVGASLPFDSWELGLALAGGVEEYKTTSAETRHKISTDSFGLTGYGIYRVEWFDWSLGAAGMFASSDSERGEYSGDFDAWRLGASTEIGATLRAQSWLAFRAFAGLSAAYSRTESFDESGGGEALSFDAGDEFGFRSTLGLSSAFAVSDALQFTLRAAWLLDFGSSECSFDAFMPSTNTAFSVDSRENESSALEAGAYLNWALGGNAEIFGGYTGQIRAGERAHSVSVGINFFF